jgi:hypothetical protein
MDLTKKEKNKKSRKVVTGEKTAKTKLMLNLTGDKKINDFKGHSQQS